MIPIGEQFTLPEPGKNQGIFGPAKRESLPART
jgi:hypothetical protein